MTFEQLGGVFLELGDTIEGDIRSAGSGLICAKRGVVRVYVHKFECSLSEASDWVKQTS